MSQAHSGQLTTHLATAESASAFSLATGGGGLVIGREPDGTVISVTLFRSEPTVVAVVAGLPFVQLISFRAVALGAELLIGTSRPEAWETLVNLAAGSSGSIHMMDRVTDVPAGSPTAPRLVVMDSEKSVGAESRSAGAWSTVLTVHDQLAEWNSGSLSGTDLVLVQSLSLVEARLVGGALGLADAERNLASLPEGTATVISRAGSRTANIVLTDIEKWLIRPVEQGRSPAQVATRPAFPRG